MRKLISAILVAFLMLFSMPSTSDALTNGRISIALGPCSGGNSQRFTLNGSGFGAGTFMNVFVSNDFGTFSFPITTGSSGTFSQLFSANGLTTYLVNSRSGSTVISNTLRYTVCGTVVDLNPPVTPPTIVMTVDDSKCGQVTVTAHGFGLRPGTTYQLVAGSGYPAATATTVADLNNSLSATFTMAQAGEWGNATVRTSAGGYLATSNAWYHTKACPK